MTRLTIRLITAPSAYLVEEPFPPRLGEEMRHHGAHALQRGSEALVEVVLAPGLVRPVDEQRLALDIVARQEAPIAAVLRVVAVVAHDEIAIRRYRHRPEPLTHVRRRDLLVIVRRWCQEVDIRLVERLVVDEDLLVTQLHGLARQADDAL